MIFLIDLIVISIIALCIFISAKRGFVKVFVEVVGFIIAITLTFTISTPLANFTYDKIIEPPISKAVNDVITNSSENIQDNAWNSLPDYVTNNAEKFGISVEDFQNKISENINSGSETAVKSALQDIIKPIITKILGLIYSIVILLILLFVVKILAKFLNKLFSFSIIGKVNTFLGGIVGIPKGIIFAILFCMLISLIVTFNNGFWIFTSANIQKTYIFKFFAEILPL